MHTKFIEATNIDAGGLNWGKFMVCRFTEEEWAYRSVVDDTHPSLLHRVGWGRDVIMVVDIQTGEGAIFRPGGYAPADLFKHKVWVCPMYEPFLEWLYKQDLSDLESLPAVVQIEDPTSALWGYRRPGEAPDAGT